MKYYFFNNIFNFENFTIYHYIFLKLNNKKL